MENNSIKGKVEKLLSKKYRNKIIAAVIAALGVVVALITAYSVSDKGQAKTYSVKELVCSSQSHRHVGACYNQEYELTCGYADYFVHVHNEDCYDSFGKLVCTLPEIYEHIHSADCYVQEKTLVCTQTESQGHIHGDECYQVSGGELICGYEEHFHTDECLDEEDNYICGLEEHEHYDECYSEETVELVCQVPEGEGAHTHTEDCYKTEAVLSCGKLELHTHKAECYEKNPDGSLIKPNADGTFTGKLICEIPELREHVHKDACFSTREMTADEVKAIEKSLDEAGNKEAVVVEGSSETECASLGHTTITAQCSETGTVITLSGVMPEGAYATAVPVEVEIEGVDIISAYDIKIYDLNGMEYQPADGAINVTIENAAIDAAEDVKVFHMEDVNAAPETVSAATSEGEAVSFQAESFSIYVVGTERPSKYTFTFICEGSEYAKVVLTAGETVNTNQQITNPEKSGYVFEGWYDENTKVVEWDALWASTTDKTLKARFTQYVYVTFLDEDGNIASEQKVAKGTAADLSVRIEPKDGQNIGWATTEESTTPINEYKPTEDATLYPVIQNGHWLTFNENGKGATYNAPVFVADKTNAPKPADPVRAGYKFDGWFTAEKGGQAFGFGTISNNTTIYAHWTMNPTANYTINYWLQKITDDVDTTNKTYDFKESETKTATSMSRVSGGNTKSYKGFDYGRGDTNIVVEPDGSTVINVYYNRKVCTINYYVYKNRAWQVDSSVKGLYQADLKEGDWRTDTNWQASYDNNGASGLVCVLLTNFDFEISGYAGNKNNVKASDGTITTCNFYKGSTGSQNIYYYNEKADGSFAYAGSAKGTGTLTFHEKFLGYDPYTYTTGSQTADLKKASFWSSKSKWVDGTQSKQTTIYISNKLQYFPITYFVGSEAKHTENVKYTASLSGYDAKYTPSVPDGQMFVGWYADEGRTEKFDFSKETMPLNGTRVYAKFEPIQYRVILEPNGGTLPEDQAASFRVNYKESIQGTALQEPLFTKDGYTLVGWFKDSNFTERFNFGTKLQDSEVYLYKNASEKEQEDRNRDNVKGKLNLYAKWVSTDVLNVAYDTNPGTGEVTDTRNYRDDAEVKASTFTATAPEGQAFIGWRLPNGELVYPGETFTLESKYVVNKVFKLTAVYTPGTKTTSLKYDLNYDGAPKAFTDTRTFVQVRDSEGNTFTNAETAVDPSLKAEDQAIYNSAIETRSENEYEFIGWSKVKNNPADSDIIPAGGIIEVDTVNPDANVLYAHWKVKLYDLVYDDGANDGTVTNMPADSQWVKNSVTKAGIDKESNTVKTPAREGYTFLGWDMYTKDASGAYTVEKGRKDSDADITITEDTKLVAAWFDQKDKTDPDNPVINITKTFTGMSKATIESELSSFYITVTGPTDTVDECYLTVPTSVTTDETTGNVTYSWIMQNRPSGTYTVVEHNASTGTESSFVFDSATVNGDTIEVTAGESESTSIATATSNISFDKKLYYEPSCSSKELPVGTEANFVVCSLTKGQNFVIWTTQNLSEAQRDAFIANVGPMLDSNLNGIAKNHPNILWYSGSKIHSRIVLDNGGWVEYTKEGKLKFGGSSVWAETEAGIYNLDPATNGDLNFVNNYKVQKDILFHKKSSGANGSEAFLEGAKFALFVGDEKIAKETYESKGIKGAFTIEGLEAGTYKLIETDAPKGYLKSDKAIEIVVGTDASVTVKYKATGEELETDEDDDGYIIYNSNGAVLPSTGGIGTTLFTVIGLLIIAMVGLLAITSVRRRRA